MATTPSDPFAFSGSTKTMYGSSGSMPLPAGRPPTPALHWFDNLAICSNTYTLPDSLSPL
jgi:hypothetical protein